MIVLSRGKMLKLLIICSALATAYGQTTGAPLLPLPYAINFNQNYQLSWGFNNDTLTIQMEVVTKGWVSLAVMNDAGNMFDVWWGGYDEDYGTAYGQVSKIQFFKYAKISSFAFECATGCLRCFHQLDGRPEVPGHFLEFECVECGPVAVWWHHSRPCQPTVRQSRLQTRRRHSLRKLQYLREICIDLSNLIIFF